MSRATRAQILADLADGDGGVTAVRLGEVCQSVTGVAGAGIMLASGDQPVGALCATDEVSALIEDLQYTLGEGPCVEAYRTDMPVLEPDLADPTVPRWLAFTGPALDAGVRAIFGFPLRVGAARLGAMDLYSGSPGPLSDDQHADAVMMAGIAAETVLAMQAGESTGVLATELEEGSNFRFVVHQAAGMVSVQLDVSVDQALVRLRAHAFANQRPLADVAVDVVARRLRFAGQDD